MTKIGWNEATTRRLSYTSLNRITEITEIEKVHRQVTRYIDGLRDLPYDLRLQSLNLPTLETRRLYLDILECYKIVHGLVRSDCRTLLILSRRNTRGFNCLLDTSRPPARLNVRKHFFVERVLSKWNALPLDLLRLSTYSNFKTALRNHLQL